MRAAQEWAERASRDDLKAHAAAIWQAMGAADRAAFCQFIRLDTIAAVMRRPETIGLPDSMKPEAAA